MRNKASECFITSYHQCTAFFWKYIWRNVNKYIKGTCQVKLRTNEILKMQQNWLLWPGGIGSSADLPREQIYQGNSWSVCNSVQLENWQTWKRGQPNDAPSLLDLCIHLSNFRVIILSVHDHDIILVITNNCPLGLWISPHLSSVPSWGPISDRTDVSPIYWQVVNYKLTLVGSAPIQKGWCECRKNKDVQKFEKRPRLYPALFSYGLPAEA